MTSPCRHPIGKLLSLSFRGDGLAPVGMVSSRGVLESSQADWCPPTTLRPGQVAMIHDTGHSSTVPQGERLLLRERLETGLYHPTLPPRPPIHGPTGTHRPL